MFVSVILPAFNAVETLPIAIETVRAQSFEDFELLVVDDGSTDATASLLETWAIRDPRVRVITHAQNRGRSAARNTAIEAARGEWLAFIDADDLWAHERLERLVAVVVSDPSVDLVTDDRMGFTVGTGGAISLGHRFPSREAWGMGGVEPLKLRGWVMDKRHVDPLVRRSLVIESGARFPENLSNAEDQSFCMQLVFAAQGCRAVRVAEPLYYYRLGETTRPEDQDLNFIRAVQIALEQTGSAELDRLIIPAIDGEFALRRRDVAMRTRVGRLAPADRSTAGTPRDLVPSRPPGRVATLRALWFRRAIVALSMLADRRARQGIVADIDRQLGGAMVDRSGATASRTRGTARRRGLARAFRS